MWRACVVHRGQRRVAYRPNREAVKQAERDFYTSIDAKVAQAEQTWARPGTLGELLTLYADDMRAWGKGQESVGRVEYTRRSIEAVLPTLLDRPVSRITDADI